MHTKNSMESKTHFNVNVKTEGWKIVTRGRKCEASKYGVFCSKDIWAISLQFCLNVRGKENHRFLEIKGFQIILPASFFYNSKNWEIRPLAKVSQ